MEFQQGRLKKAHLIVIKNDNSALHGKWRFQSVPSSCALWPFTQIHSNEALKRNKQQEPAISRPLCSY